MAEENKLAIEVAAVLDEFVASQRREAIAQANKQRLTFVRQIGEGQIVCEMVIDEGEDSKSIYEKLSRIEGASNRLKANVDLNGHYGRILNNCGQIEMAQKKLAEMMVAADAKRAAASVGRRQLVAVSDADKAGFRQQEDAIKDCRDKIEETQKAIEECKRILGGEDPFEVLADQIAKRLRMMKGIRIADAA